MATGLVTLYDVVRSMFVQSGALDAPPVSFAEDILPLFARLPDMQWVSEGYLENEGFGSGHDWLAPATSSGWPTPRRALPRTDAGVIDSRQAGGATQTVRTAQRPDGRKPRMTTGSQEPREGGQVLRRPSDCC